MPRRERPKGYPREVLSLPMAASDARFALHTMLLGQSEEGAEIAGELLTQLQRSLTKVYAPEAPPPICSGCSPLKHFEDAEFRWPEESEARYIARLDAHEAALKKMDEQRPTEEGG